VDCFSENPKLKFHENFCGGSTAVQSIQTEREMDGRTYITTLVGAFRNINSNIAWKYFILFYTGQV